MSSQPASALPDGSATALPGTAAPGLSDLLERLPELMLRDQQRLGRRLDGARRIRKPEARTAVLSEISDGIDEAELRVEQRRAAVPEITYPEELPVSQKKDEILAAIRDHQVVIVAERPAPARRRRSPRSAWSSAGASGA